MDHYDDAGIHLVVAAVVLNAITELPPNLICQVRIQRKDCVAQVISLQVHLMVRDPCNLYTKELFPQSHAGEQCTVSSRRSLSISLSQVHLIVGHWCRFNMYKKGI